MSPLGWLIGVIVSVILLMRAWHAGPVWGIAVSAMDVTAIAAGLLLWRHRR
ncbi:MAG: hypothetical protein ACLP9Y_09310 [Mycobacterium sp.]